MNTLTERESVEISGGALPIFPTSDSLPKFSTYRVPSWDFSVPPWVRPAEPSYDAVP
jgi:hypothetical protein